VYQGLRIIDFHVHFPMSGGGGSRRAERHPALIEYDRQRQARMQLEWDTPAPEPPGAPEEAADRWAAEVDRYGLDRVVFVTGGGNEPLAGVLARHPDKFFGLAHNRPEDPDSAEQLRHGIEDLGLKGYKLLAPTIGLPLDHPHFRPLWQFLADRRLPVLIHFGVLGRAGGTVYHPLMSPLTLAPVAREFLDIPFVIPHFGCGYIQDLLQLCWALPNIHVDTSGSNQWMRWMPYPLTLEDAFRKFYEMIGPERIVFGTDSSWFPRGFSVRYLQDQLRACRYLNLPEADIAKIFGGNAARLLHL
jgi:predicted TIM-barrel fold metal-dependent hydrolase